MALRFAFAQSHVGEGRIGEHTVWHQPIARAAVRSRQIIPDDQKIVVGYMGKLRASGAFPESPDIGRRRLQPLVDANLAATVQLDASLLEPDPVGVWNSPRCDQDVAALDVLLTGCRAQGNADFLSGSAVHVEGLCREYKSNTFVTENPLNFIRDIRILPAQDLRARTL